MAKGWLVALIVVAIVGAALVAVGGGMIPFLSSRVHTSINDNVKLVNNSEAYKAWKSPPAPIFLDFYFFDVLNPDDIVKGSKPIVRERGPYVYREVREKLHIEFVKNNTMLYYKENKAYVFDREKSNGTEEDNITTVNIAMVTIAHQHRYDSNLVRLFLRWGATLFKEQLFESHSVREMLWGYTPSILDKLRALFKLWHLNPSILPNITVGFYVGDTGNGTDNGLFEIETGVSDIKGLGLVKSWNDTTNLTYWTTPECNMINGTDGTLWHPFIEKRETLYVFNTDLCRSIYVAFDSETTVSASDIPVYRFVPPAMVMANESVNPDNAGFCIPAGNCLGAGVLNVSVCRGNVPIIMSQPHFFEAADRYQSAIDGLEPRDTAHRTSVDIEPNTGLVFNAAKKLQINFHLDKHNDVFQPLIDLNESYTFPIFWANEHAVISDEDAARFRREVLTPVLTASILPYVLIGLGALLLLIVIILVIIIAVKHRTSRDATDEDDPLISDAADGGLGGDDPMIANA